MSGKATEWCANSVFWNAEGPRVRLTTARECRRYPPRAESDLDAPYGVRWPLTSGTDWRGEQRPPS